MFAFVAAVVDFIYLCTFFFLIGSYTNILPKYLFFSSCFLKTLDYVALILATVSSISLHLSQATIIPSSGLSEPSSLQIRTLPTQMVF